MPASPLTLQELKSDLWNCAQILRGSAIERPDWKGYVLPLLFFKRISDVWDEEAVEARETYGDVDLERFPELHRCTLPGGCHWRDVRETPANVGVALASAMRAIERANPDTLARAFGAADCGNRKMLGDELLKDLVEGLSGVPLGNKAVAFRHPRRRLRVPDRQIRRHHAAQEGGGFYTPRTIVRMMVDLLDPQAGEAIYDPPCGTGGLLLGATEHAQRAGADPRTFCGRIFAEEKNLTRSSIARMNLVLHGVEDFRIEQDDTLRHPAFCRSGQRAADVRLRHRQSAVIPQGVGPRGLGGGSVVPRSVRPPAGQLRRLRLGSPDGGVAGGGLGSDGGGAAAGRVAPHGRGGPHPRGDAGTGSRRGSDRARTQYLLPATKRTTQQHASPRVT